MVFNATFNNMSVILWWPVLMKETGVHGEFHGPVASHYQTLSHNVVSNTPRPYGIRTHKVSGVRNTITAQLYKYSKPESRNKFIFHYTSFYIFTVYV